MKISLIGKNQLVAALKRTAKKHKKDANDLVAGAALRTVAKAKMRLQPLDGDSEGTVQDVVDVRGSIGFDHNRETVSATIHAGNVSNDDIAAYLEFGTGPYAKEYLSKKPQVIRDYAMTFFVNGRGRTAAHPYLIPSWEEEGVKLSEKLKGLKPSW